MHHESRYRWKVAELWVKNTTFERDNNNNFQHLSSCNNNETHLIYILSRRCKNNIDCSANLLPLSNLVRLSYHIASNSYPSHHSWLQTTTSLRYKRSKETNTKSAEESLRQKLEKRAARVWASGLHRWYIKIVCCVLHNNKNCKRNRFSIFAKN